MVVNLDEVKARYPEAVTFRLGDSAELSAELIGLIRAGKKRASCFSILDIKAGETAPQVGRSDIALNWDGTPALVIRTVELRDVRFSKMTEEMALMEGEDDSLESWQAGHRRYFERHNVFDPEMLLTWERFELVEDLA